MVDYKFKTVENYLFYILNAFGHDWIHDFNNYKRMSVIQKHINGLCIYINSQVPSGRGGSMKGGNLPDSGNEEITSENYKDLIGTYDDDILFKYCDDKGDEYQLDMGDFLTDDTNRKERNRIIAVLNDVYNNYVIIKDSRYMTRNKLHTLQMMDNYINELKLCIFGYLELDNKEDSGGSKHVGGGSLKIIDNISNKSINNAFDNFIVNAKLEKDDIEELQEPDIKELENNMELFKKTMKFFKKIFNYITIEEGDGHPLDILNSTLIENILSFCIINCHNNEFMQIIDETWYCKMLINFFIKKNDEREIKSLIEIKKEKIRIKQQKEMKEMNNISFNNQYIAPVGVGGSKIQYGGIKKADFEDLKLNENYDPMIQLYNDYKEINEDNIIKKTEDVISLIKKNIDVYNFWLKELIASSQQQSIITKLINDFSSKLNAIKPGRNQTKQQTKLALDTFALVSRVFVNLSDHLLRFGVEVDDRSESSTLTTEQRDAVQNISRIVAKLMLERCIPEEIYNNDNTPQITNTVDPDLNKQMEILLNVKEGRGFTGVDNELDSYILTNYKGKKENILIKKDAIDKLTTLIKPISAFNVDKDTRRVINNAIDKKILDVVLKAKDAVVCPTSSVCDGMKSYGNCFGKDLIGREEYRDMDFQISDPDNNNNFVGTTTYSNKKGRKTIIITYTVLCNSLYFQVPGFTMDISSSPIDLQANISFKNVINQILLIWKTQNINPTDLYGLWDILENYSVFESILQVGSKKAIGDIFQEINSTLENSGYTNNFDVVNAKTTFGLMGDRPSGARVIKLLKDAESGINPKAIGGYISAGTTNTNNKTYIYVPTRMMGGKKQSRKRRKHKRRTNNKKTKKRKTLKKRKSKRFSRSKK